ncbi:MAG: hypothetical protein FWH36_02035 [Lentimicrobiaceae bacterium]|nr:hypothetical protein [Lentimicrobiaceae bacterium]
MKSVYKRRFFLCGLLFFVCHSCFNDKADDCNVLNINEQALPCTVKCNNTINGDSGNILPIDIANQLYKHLNRFEGEQFNILTKMPENWAIECMLPSFSPDFAIWIVSNVGESAVKLLATLTTAENPMVIQALPIAYNIAIEKTNYIESEFWTADIDNSYNIIVTKKYERLYSIIEENTENKSVSVTKKDNYTIELNGKIAYQKPETFDADYLAIVQFADTAVVGMLDEDWVLNSMEIQEKIEPLGIFFVTATSDFDKVEIKNYHGETVDIVDISSFINRHNMGYLALKKGEKTLFIPYSAADVCLQKVENQFNMEILTENEE